MVDDEEEARGPAQGPADERGREERGEERSGEERRALVLRRVVNHDRREEENTAESSPAS